MPQLARRIPFDPAKYKPRAWFTKHRVAIGTSLSFGGFALLVTFNYFHLQGTFATSVRYIAAVAVILGLAFRRFSLFRRSRVNERNRGKFLVVLALLWLVILPAACLFAFHALRK
jgi:predicted permease